MTLVEVQRLTTGRMGRPRMVTGASATLDGGTVAIRTYETLEFFAITGGERLLESDLGRVDLRALREAQGEGVAFGANGTILLTSESAGGVGPSLTFLSCNLNPAALDQPEPTRGPPALSRSEVHQQRPGRSTLDPQGPPGGVIIEGKRAH